MHRLISISLLCAVGLGQTAYAAQKCPASGILEKLIEPEKTEDGFVRISELSSTRWGATYWKREAKYEVMTETEYNALPADMNYETYQWHATKTSRTEVNVNQDIDAFDIVHTVDGNSFMRPLEKTFNRTKLYDTHIDKQKWREIIQKTEKRPPPKKLDDGRLKVMITPQYFERYVPYPERDDRIVKEWRSYIKKRTAAVYKQVKCEPAN